jgi:hypothetical protein
VLSDAFDSQHAVCTECRGRTASIVRAKSEDGKKSIHLEARSLGQSTNASGPNTRSGYARRPSRWLATGAPEYNREPENSDANFARRAKVQAHARAWCVFRYKRERSLRVSSHRVHSRARRDHADVQRKRRNGSQNANNAQAHTPRNP